MTHICVRKLNSIGSDNGLFPGRRQAIIWTNAGILLIGLLGTNFSEILIEIHILSVKKMHLNMSSGNWWPFCSSFNVLMGITIPGKTAFTLNQPTSYFLLMLLVTQEIKNINSSPPGQNGRHFADDIFRWNFVNEKFCILTQISLKFVPKGPIDNISALA